MMKKILMSMFSVVFASISVTSNAAEFFVLPNSNNLLMLGKTKISDVDILLGHAKSGEIDTIILNGPGGNLDAGFVLADIVFKYDLSVLVPKDTDCASACSLIFAAGKKRKMEDGARLGFHLPFLILNDENVDDYCDSLKPKSLPKKYNSADVLSLMQAQKFRIGGAKYIDCITSTFQTGLSMMKKLSKILARDGISEALIDIVISTRPSEMEWFDIRRAKEVGLLRD